MSTALQLHSFSLPVARPVARVWAVAGSTHSKTVATAASLIRQLAPPAEVKSADESEPGITYAFYRKHTEGLLRRYLYASMQVGRSPSILGESIGRGWVSSRKVRTFEDAVIFVLDIERCLDKLSQFDRQLISRLVLQEYTHTEAASLMGISARSLCKKFPQAIDRLTVMLLESEILILP